MNYYIDPGIPDVERLQITNAFTMWNAAGVGRWGVIFRPSDDNSANYRLYNGSLGACTNGVGALTTVISPTVAFTAFDPSNCITAGHDPNVPGFETFWLKVALHEIGHTLGLGHPPGTERNCAAQPDGVTVMNDGCTVNDIEGNMPANPNTFCDTSTLQTIFPPPPPPPPPSGGGGCGFSRITPLRCMAGEPCCPSPIVVDVDGNGYDLTGTSNGVVFDIDASGHPEQVAWTSTGSDDAWLVLDRNGNGVIDDATELFGDHTPQPPSDHKNGFLALAVFDDPANGGNGDGWISRDDAVYSALRLWVDRNHNGVSEPGELYPLQELGVNAIGLEFQSSRRVDEHGNAFSYRARINRARGAHDGRWAYDVFLMAGSAGAP